MAGNDGAAKEAAEALAIGVLSWLAGEPDLIRRFAALSGIDLADMRKASAEPGFLPGVLDFVLAHEPTLIAHCAQAGISPEQVRAARRTLSQSYGGAPE